MLFRREYLYKDEIFFTKNSRNLIYFWEISNWSFPTSFCLFPRIFLAFNIFSILAPGMIVGNRQNEKWQFLFHHFRNWKVDAKRNKSKVLAKTCFLPNHEKKRISSHWFRDMNRVAISKTFLSVDFFNQIVAIIWLIKKISLFPMILMKWKKNFKHLSSKILRSKSFPSNSFSVLVVDFVWKHQQWKKTKLCLYIFCFFDF